MTKSKIYTILWVAFVLRLILLLINQFWFTLPQGGGDAIFFDRMAYEGRYGFINSLSSGAHLFTYYGTFLYSIFGRAPFIWAFTMLLLGVGTVYNVYNGALLISNNYKLANRAAWIACLFPNFALLSVMILREAPIHFFLSLAIVQLLKFLKYKKSISLVYFFISGLVAAIFHSGVFALFFGFLVYNFLFNGKSKFVTKLFIIVISAAGLYYVNAKGLGLSKFGGSFEGALDSLSEAKNLRGGANTNYPEWLVMKGGVTDFVILPIRILALLFAPFIPFFARSASHLIGVFDGLCYFIIFWRIFKNRAILMKNELVKPVFIIILSLTFAFALGANNFGTNIRHRAKFFPLLVIIPFITGAENKKYTQRQKKK